MHPKPTTNFIFNYNIWNITIKLLFVTIINVSIPAFFVQYNNVLLQCVAKLLCLKVRYVFVDLKQPHDWNILLEIYIRTVYHFPTKESFYIQVSYCLLLQDVKKHSPSMLFIKSLVNTKNIVIYNYK